MDTHESITDCAEQELAHRARAGSREAFDEIARRLRPRIAAYLACRAGRSDGIEDLCQETLLRLHRGLDGYDPARPIMPWVLTIASNVAAEAARRRCARPGAAPLGAPEPPDGRSVEPWQAAADAERRETIWRTARRVLRPREFEAIHLHYAGGADVATVAAAMGLTRTHVKVLLHRARKKLLRVPQLREEV